ncbi:hypothetical protein SAMN05192574_105255 [Mucilaginibacter gossypiicola]|uniref:Uncharacterized protein n=1 Tax=Mucilaginibacter gossypiicola TaxID=551995 RepID=A0A1H8LV51_9SPHI|nr:hypothetical protein [Mucilaginibacter gossypiicola]SEO08758.1 hypothetical protein SAMN05192574_105255 [Mucilaginibacter gossypiicola]
MDTIRINCIIGSTHCDIVASETELPEHKGPCFELRGDNLSTLTICKTVEGNYIHIGQTELTQDDIDAIGEQIDGELSSF